MLHSRSSTDVTTLFGLEFSQMPTVLGLTAQDSSSRDKLPVHSKRPQAGPAVSGDEPAVLSTDPGPGHAKPATAAPAL